MASLIFLLLIIAKIRASPSVSCTSNTQIRCNIDCKQEQTCINQVLSCDAMLDCRIHCHGFGNNRRLKQKIQKSTPNNARNLLPINACKESDGCCGSTIHCPFDKQCSIDCSQGCKNVTVHAENASSLLITHCNNRSDDVYCTNMDINCPQNKNGNNTNPICIIEGNIIETTNIYTKHGFDDLELRYSISVIDTNVFYSNIGAEYVCAVTEDGSGCDLILSSNPTTAPTIKQNELSLYSTKQPTVEIINEGQIEITSTKYGEIFEDTEEASASWRGRVYGFNIEIVILSALCFFLLMGCMLFCTLWMLRNGEDSNNKTENVVTQIQNESNHAENAKHAMPMNLYMDNLHVWSGSNIISPRTQSAITSMCTVNSGMSDIDINLSFDDVIGTDVGEDPDLNPNLKDDEFIIGEDDEYYEPGNQTPINNV